MKAYLHYHFLDLWSHFFSFFLFFSPSLTSRLRDLSSSPGIEPRHLAVKGRGDLTTGSPGSPLEGFCVYDHIIFVSSLTVVEKTCLMLGMLISTKMSYVDTCYVLDTLTTFIYVSCIISFNLLCDLLLEKINPLYRWSNWGSIKLVVSVIIS